MFDFAWSELLIIGAVALVVIGPKDLPRALRTLGVVVRRARALAQEFHSTVDEMIREADLEEVRKTAREATRFDPDRAFNKIIEGDAKPAPQALMAPHAGPLHPGPLHPEPARPEPAPALTHDEPTLTPAAPIEAPHIEAPGP